MSEYIVRMPNDMPYEIKAELNAWYVESEPIVRCRDCMNVDVEDYGPWGASGIVRDSAKLSPTATAHGVREDK